MLEEEKNRKAANRSKLFATGTSEAKKKQYQQAQLAKSQPVKNTNWYKGEKPTQRETLARIYDIGNREPEKRDSLMQMYQAELSNPTSPIYNPYSSATTTSLSKTNLNNTLKAHQEWAELSKELTWWAQHPSRNYSDDEIISRVDWNKYKTLAKMDAGRENGSPLALTEAVGYSKDAMYGVLWAARNPNQSTGDAMLDAVQGVLGRGKQYQLDEKTANRLNPMSAEYNPYAVGGTMDELLFKYGIYSVDQEWLDSHRYMISNPDTNADYGKLFNAAKATEALNVEAQSFNSDVARLLEAGQPVDVDKIIELGEYDHLKKLRESLKSGQLIDTTAAIDFDPYLLQTDADAYLHQVTGDYTTDQYDQMLSDNMGGSYMPDESKQNSEELRKLNTDVTLPEYIPVATDAERKAFRVTANAGYSDVVFTTADMVVNGAGGDAQAKGALQKEVHAYANQNLFDAWADSEMSADEKAFLQEYFPELLESGRMPTMDDFGLLDMSGNEKTAMDVMNEWNAIASVDRSARYNEASDIIANVMDALAEVYGEGTDQYNAAVATYEMAYAYTRGVPKVWRAWDAYQDASAEGPITVEYGNNVLTNQRGSNARDIRVLNALIENAEIMGLPERYIENMRQQAEDLKTQNDLLNAHKLQENEDYDQQIADFDAQYQPYKPAWFSKPSHAEVVMHAVYDPEAAIALGAAEKSDTVMLAQAMTPEERNNYKYKFMTEGEESATAYFDALSENLYVRAAEERSERTQEWASENEWNSALATIGSVAMTPLEGFSALATVVSELQGNEVNPYGPTFLFTQAKSDLRTGTKAGFEEAYGDNKVLTAIYNTFYDALTSAADSGISTLTGGKYGSMILGLSGFNSAVMDASMRGASDERAFLYGIASACIEAATEKSQIDKMLGAFKNGSAGVRGFLSEVLTGFASEAGEEALSSVLGTIADDQIMQAMSNREAAIQEYIGLGLSLEEAEQQANRDILTGILYDGLVGGISGGLSTTAGYAAGKVFGGADQPVQNEQNEQPAGTPVQRAEAALSTSMQEGVGEVQQTATVAGVLQSFGLSDMEANAAAKNIVGSTNTRILRKMLSQAEDPVGLINAIAMGSVSERSRSWAVLHNARVDSKNAKNVGDQLIAAYNEDVNDQSVMTEYDARVAFDAQADATANIIATSGQVDTSALDKAREQSTNAQLEMDRVEAEVEAAHQAVVEAQNRFNANPGDDKAKQALKEAINLQYKARERSEAAKRNAILAKKNLAKANADFKSQTEANMIAAREQAKAEVQQRKEVLEAQKQEAAVAAEQKRQSDNVLAMQANDFVERFFPEAPDGIKEQIRQRYMSYGGKTQAVTRGMKELTNQFSKKFGLKFEFLDSHGIFEGAAMADGNTIVLDQNATQGDLIRAVLSHELAHIAEGSEDYGVFATAVLEAYYDGNTDQMNADLSETAKRYAEQYGQKGEQLARTELVAKRLSEMISSKPEAFERLAQEKPDVATRIWRAIKDFVNKLRGVSDPELDKIFQIEKMLEKALLTRGGRKNQVRFELRGYSETERTNWSNSKRIVLYEDDAQAMEFIQNALNDKSFSKKLYFGAVSPELGEYLLEKTGLDVEGYNCTLNSNEVNKVLKKHGNKEQEALSGQRAILPKDFLKIKTVMESPDDASLSPDTYDGKPAIVFEKEIDGSKVSVVAVVSDKHLDLRMQTMYAGKQKKTSRTVEAEAPLSENSGLSRNLATPTPAVSSQSPTPEAARGTVPVNIIAREAEKVNLSIPSGSGKPVDENLRFSLPSNDILDQSIAQHMAGANEPWVDQQKKSQFAVKTGQGTNVLTDETKKKLLDDPYYTTTSQKKTLAIAVDRIGKEGYQKRRDMVLNGATSLLTPEGQTEAYVLCKLAKESGDSDGEANLAFMVKESGTQLAQSLAMRRMYIQMTPEGKLKYVQRAVNKINADYEAAGKDTRVEVPDWLEGALTDANGDAKLTEQALDDAYREIAAQMPPSLSDTLNSWRYLAMLGNPMTHVKNLAGNLAYAPYVFTRNKVSAALQAAFKKDPIDRTRTLGPIKKEYKEFAKVITALQRNALTGESTATEKNALGKIDEYRQKAYGDLDKVAKFNSHLMAAEDLLFKNVYFTNALAGFLQARQANLNDLDPQLLNAGIQFALDEARKNTFNNINQFAKWLAEAQNKLKKEGGFKKVGYYALEGILPFKNTPANILSRGVEFSPAGLVYALTVDTAKLIKGKDFMNGNKPYTFSNWADNVSAGVTGGVLAAGLGFLLASIGVLHVDEDELEGKQENSVDIAGQNIVIDWAGTASMPILMGARLHSLWEEQGKEMFGDGFELSELDDVFVLFGDAMSEVTDPMINLSVLQGVSNLVESASYGDNAFSAMGSRIATTFVSQFWPSAFGAFARLIDDTRRTTYADKNSSVPSDLQYFVQSMRNKIPFASYEGMPYMDSWGNEQSNGSFWRRLVNNFLLPGYSKAIETPDGVEKMLSDLFEETQESGIEPTKPSKYFTANKETYNMSAEEYERLTKLRGQTAYDLFEQLMQQQDFYHGNDVYKVKAVKLVWDYANQTAKSAINDGYSVDSWILNTSDPIKDILEKSAEAQADYEVNQHKEGLYEAIRTGNHSDIIVYVDALRQNGVKTKSLKTAITNKMKPLYRRFYSEGDQQALHDLEAALYATGALSPGDLADWIVY